MTLDVTSVLLQWAAGGLAFCWVTTRRREVGLGYGWLLRSSFGALGALGVISGLGDSGSGAVVRNGAGALMVVAAGVALVVSVAGRSRGLAGFDPRLDLIAPVFGLVALGGSAAAIGGPYPLSLARLVIGAAFLGAVTDAMLLGHWYLVQPGLGRQPIRELVVAAALCWPVEVALMLVPRGMVDVLGGSIDDGYGGVLGAMWVVSALTTIGLLGATWLALRERYYSAVMAATGLLYLAILTAFGTDVLARSLYTT